MDCKKIIMIRKSNRVQNNINIKRSSKKKMIQNPDSELASTIYQNYKKQTLLQKNTPLQKAVQFLKNMIQQNKKDKFVQKNKQENQQQQQQKHNNENENENENGNANTKENGNENHHQHHQNNNHHQDASFMRGIYVSFNGGKDATLVLFLLYFAMRELEIHQNIECLYFSQPHPFPQTLKFIKTLYKTLPLSEHNLGTKCYQSQLLYFSLTHPVKNIIMGTRSTDPGCSHLQCLSPSDVNKGYPIFMRVLPILHWSCSQVWKIIKLLQIPYCPLYEQGYTSIGNMSNTKKNEKLAVEGGTWIPAYHIEGEAADLEERKFRN